MPGHDGQPLPSESVSRDRQHARVIITLEVTVSQEGLEELPNYRRTAADYIKALWEEDPTLLDDLLETFSKGHMSLHSERGLPIVKLEAHQ